MITKIFIGHEVIGLENIPDKGAAIIIFYHSGFVIEFIYTVASILLNKNRRIIPIVDKTMFNLPGYNLIFNIFSNIKINENLIFIFHLLGLKTWLEASESTAGSFDTLVNDLNNGEIIAIAPGGVSRK